MEKVRAAIAKMDWEAWVVQVQGVQVQGVPQEVAQKATTAIRSFRKASKWEELRL